MKKRLLAIAAILVAIVGAIVLILALLPAKPGVTKANFDRLEIGMSLDEVESVFGEQCRKTSPENKVWEREEGFAVIQFSGSGQVEKTDWGDRSISLWQKLQRWLPWLPD